MRQQHGGETGVVLRLVIFEPENFRRGEAGQDGVAERLERLLWPAQLLGDLSALCCRRGVAPEFGGADHFSGLVQRHEAVLLSAHPDGLHLGGVCLRAAQCLSYGARRGLAPGVGMLLLRSGRQVGNQLVGLHAGAENLAGPGVNDKSLGGLGAAVDADQKCSHRLKNIGPEDAGVLKMCPARGGRGAEAWVVSATVLRSCHPERFISQTRSTKHAPLLCGVVQSTVAR